MENQDQQLTAAEVEAAAKAAEPVQVIDGSVYQPEYVDESLRRG